MHHSSQMERSSEFRKRMAQYSTKYGTAKKSEDNSQPLQPERGCDDSLKINSINLSCGESKSTTAARTTNPAPHELYDTVKIRETIENMKNQKEMLLFNTCDYSQRQRECENVDQILSELEADIIMYEEILEGMLSERIRGAISCPERFSTPNYFSPTYPIRNAPDDSFDSWLKDIRNNVATMTESSSTLNPSTSTRTNTQHREWIIQRKKNGHFSWVCKRCQVEGASFYKIDMDSTSLKPDFCKCDGPNFHNLASRREIEKFEKSSTAHRTQSLSKDTDHCNPCRTCEELKVMRGEQEKYGDLFDEVPKEEWQKCKIFAKEYDEGKYTKGSSYTPHTQRGDWHVQEVNGGNRWMCKVCNVQSDVFDGCGWTWMNAIKYKPIVCQCDEQDYLTLLKIKPKDADHCDTLKSMPNRLEPFFPPWNQRPLPVPRETLEYIRQQKAMASLSPTEPLEFFQ